VRFVVLGAGAIGGALGGGLHRAGHDVTLIARGRTEAVLRSSGLTLQTPDADEVLRVPVGTVDDVRDGDVVILAVKSQDTATALEPLAGRDVTIVCAQNGVANEAAALRRFERVYGVFVWLPAQHLDPGVIQIFCAPVQGVLAVGRYPSGADETAAALAAAFTEASADGVVSDDVMRLKRGKLLDNLINGIHVVVGDGDEAERLYEQAAAEARACFDAAGLDYESDTHALGSMSPPRDVHGAGHAMSSTWQSLQRGSSLETDYLNGEIVLLGRLHGVPTPVNADIQRRAHNLNPT
jgi:2-dehydropantoate 2-reductase